MATTANDDYSLQRVPMAERRHWFLEADAATVILLLIGAFVLVYRMG